MASSSEIGFQASEQVAGADGQSGAGGDPSSESLARVSEEDVLADVELYLAYGMNDQAISSLEHAINEGHDSLLYRVRLLEAHGANDDADTVRQQAEALRAELGPDDADWLSRIAAVEHMMSGTLGAATSQGSEGTATASTASDLSESDRAATSVPNGSLPEMPPGPGVTKPDTPEFGRLEATPTTADVGFDQATGGTSDENLLQFDLEDLESPADSGKTSSEASAGGTDGGAADLPPLDLTAAGAPSAESGAQGPEQASPSTAEDASEVGMKLNLAEAFADMGDREGALALLNEVASAGTEAQAAKAEKIRSKLDLK
jgi:pilus assembly protein FimV